MIKMFLVLIPTAIIAVLLIALLFIIVPDFWIESLNDKNLLKKLMNNDYFKVIYIMTALVVTTMTILFCVHLGGFLLGIPWN